MNKREYEFKLKSGLLRFPKEIQDYVYQSFKSHFAEAKRQGKSTNAILQEFGSPDYVISEVERIVNGKSPICSVDKLWIAKSEYYARETMNYRMGVSIFVPLILLVLYVLHYLRLL